MRRPLQKPARRRPSRRRAAPRLCAPIPRRQYSWRYSGPYNLRSDPLWRDLCRQMRRRLASGAMATDLRRRANCGETLREAVSELDRHGHAFFGFIAAETKPQPLVARAAGIHAHRDIRRLAFDGAHDGAGVTVIAVSG